MALGRIPCVWHHDRPKSDLDHKESGMGEACSIAGDLTSAAQRRTCSDRAPKSLRWLPGRSASSRKGCNYPVKIHHDGDHRLVDGICIPYLMSQLIDL